MYIDIIIEQDSALPLLEGPRLGTVDGKSQAQESGTVFLSPGDSEPFVGNVTARFVHPSTGRSSEAVARDHPCGLHLAGSGAVRSAAAHHPTLEGVHSKRVARKCGECGKTPVCLQSLSSCGLHTDTDSRGFVSKFY